MQGKSPTRQWLVYAHSPLKDRKAVGVTIPDYKAVTIDVPVGASPIKLMRRGEPQNNCNA